MNSQQSIFWEVIIAEIICVWAHHRQIMGILFCFFKRKDLVYDNDTSLGIKL